ncbi:MAG: PASTA domain-containing protein [Bacteroidales bacterium]|nr:PASTA domain-containing protein [Bacteroidales bacterium]
MKFDFFKSRIFLINIAVIVGVSIVLIWAAFKFLDIYSRHGQTYMVPDFLGRVPSEIKENPDFKNFEFQIIDSVYDNTLPGGVVFSQDPLPGTEVKKNRTIYLSIVQSSPEMVELPDLGNTERQALSQIAAYGFNVGKINRVHSRYPGLLIDFYYMGKKIKPGIKLPKGSKIDLDIGDGNHSGVDSVDNDDYIDYNDDE